MQGSIIMILLAMTTSWAHAQEDGSYDIFADVDDPSVGAATFSFVDVVSVTFEHRQDNLHLLVGMNTAEDLPPEWWDVSYRLRFEGEWLETGELSVQLRAGRPVLSTLAIQQDEGLFAFSVHSEYDTTDRLLRVDVPRGVLSGPLENARLNTMWTPCSTLNCVTGPTAAVIGDRVPNTGAFDPIAP